MFEIGYTLEFSGVIEVDVRPRHHFRNVSEEKFKELERKKAVPMLFAVSVFVIVTFRTQQLAGIVIFTTLHCCNMGLLFLEDGDVNGRRYSDVIVSPCIKYSSSPFGV